MTTRTILHNVLARLRLAGELDDETDENERALNPSAVVEEFYIEKHAEEVASEEEASSPASGDVFQPSRLQNVLGRRDTIQDLDTHRKLLHAVEDIFGINHD